MFYQDQITEEIQDWAVDSPREAKSWREAWIVEPIDDDEQWLAYVRLAWPNIYWAREEIILAAPRWTDPTEWVIWLESARRSSESIERDTLELLYAAFEAGVPASIVSQNPVWWVAPPGSIDACQAICEKCPGIGLPWPSRISIQELASWPAEKILVYASLAEADNFSEIWPLVKRRRRLFRQLNIPINLWARAVFLPLEVLRFRIDNPAWRHAADCWMGILDSSDGFEYFRSSDRFEYLRSTLGMPASRPIGAWWPNVAGDYYSTIFNGRRVLDRENSWGMIPRAFGPVDGFWGNYLVLASDGEDKIVISTVNGQVAKKRLRWTPRGWRERREPQPTRRALARRAKAEDRFARLEFTPGRARTTSPSQKSDGEVEARIRALELAPPCEEACAESDGEVEARIRALELAPPCEEACAESDGEVEARFARLDLPGTSLPRREVELDSWYEESRKIEIRRQAMALRAESRAVHRDRRAQLIAMAEELEESICA